MLNGFLNLLFPQTCPLCQNPSSEHNIAPICAECWQTILPYTGPSCRKCGAPLVSDAAATCGNCLKDAPSFKRAVSFGLYDGALRSAINLLKYKGIRRLSGPLSDVMLGIDIPDVDAVIPVPLYEKRLRQREFNQSALLAANIARHLGAGLVTDCLVKTRDTAPQVGLRSWERIKNIKRAFDTRNVFRIRGRNILLVDDVVTTGATVRECSGALKKAGAGDIYVAALAHGVRD